MLYRWNINWYSHIWCPKKHANMFLLEKWGYFLGYPCTLQIFHMITTIFCSFWLLPQLMLKSVAAPTSSRPTSRTWQRSSWTPRAALPCWGRTRPSTWCRHVTRVYCDQWSCDQYCVTTSDCDNTGCPTQLSCNFQDTLYYSYTQFSFLLLNALQYKSYEYYDMKYEFK